MSSWIDSVTDRIKKLPCDLANFESWLFGTLRESARENGFDDWADIGDSLSQLLREKLCNKTPLSSPPVLPSANFQGGQCENLFYRIRLIIDYTDLPNFYQTVPSSGYFEGKITAIEDGGSTRIRIIHDSGNQVYEVPTRPVGITSWRWDATIAYEQISSPPFYIPVSDSCGNPPSPKPSDEFVDNRPIDYIDENGSSKSDPISIKIKKPYISDDCYFVFPFELNFGGKIQTGEVNFSLGDVQFKDAPQLLNCFGIKSDNPQGDGDGDSDERYDDEPLPDSGKPEILGVIINSKEVGNNSESIILDTDKAPSLIIPYLALVRFKVFVDGKEAWTDDYRVKSVKCFVPSPRGVEVKEVSVAWESGWNGKYQTVRQKARKCCSKCS